MVDKSSTYNDDRFVDPMFAIPEGLRNYRHDGNAPAFDSEEVVDEDFLDLGYFDEDDTAYEDIDDELTDSDALDAPDEFSIVSQTVKTMADGTQLVDVVVSVEDIENATNYEFRVVKV